MIFSRYLLGLEYILNNFTKRHKEKPTIEEELERANARCLVLARRINKARGNNCPEIQRQVKNLKIKFERVKKKRAELVKKIEEKG